MLGLVQVGLEHFQLKADAACFPAQQEFGVRKGKAISIGFQRVALIRVVLQLCPSVGEPVFSQVLRCFFCVIHGGIVGEKLSGKQAL